MGTESVSDDEKPTIPLNCRFDNRTMFRRSEEAMNFALTRISIASPSPSKWAENGSMRVVLKNFSG
jgi:hypothetical protein